MMTNVENEVKFFCSYCQQDITKFSKTEKESHWALVHFSDQLSQFTDKNMCKLCNYKNDDEIKMRKHVGINHKKIYEFLSVVPPEVMTLVMKARFKKLYVANFTNKFAKHNPQSNDVQSSTNLNDGTIYKSRTIVTNTARHTDENNKFTVAAKENKDVENSSLLTSESVCSMTFENKVNLAQPPVHNLRKKPFACEEGNFSANGKDKLKVHQNVKRLKVGHQCSLCNKSHRSRWHMNNHMQSAHGDRICRICDRIFCNRRSLSKHLLSLSHRVKKGKPGS